MKFRLPAGILLIILGLILAHQGKRPWIDYDFISAWYGLLFVLDSIATFFGAKSLFSNTRTYLLVACVSACFWWFYEGINLQLQNWAYPLESLYDPSFWGVFATIAFTTVIPLIIISTNIIVNLLIKNFQFLNKKLTKPSIIFFIFLGCLSFVLCLAIPIYSFPLVWFIFFFIFDPINAYQGKRSLIVQFMNRNGKIFLIFLLASLLAGVCWETMNHFIPKWTYPIEPWFWHLPYPITIKYFQMPVLGLFGYIPFSWSAFALIEFLDLPVPWLNEKPRLAKSR